MKLKYKFYKLLNKYILSNLGNSIFSIKLKWEIAIFMIGTEFHEFNLKNNKEQLSKYFDKNMLLQKDLAELLDDLNINNPKILDVGAGPISKVGKVYNGNHIQLEPIDPLANKYKKILKDNNLIPPVFTKPGYGEYLSKLYNKNTFDLVHARNSLDYTKNPMAIINEMLTVVKQDHYIYLNHYLNEGENANYYGLHQWNFSVNNGDFIIKNKNNSININVNKELKHKAIVFTELNKNRIVVRIKKN